MLKWNYNNAVKCIFYWKNANVLTKKKEKKKR